MNDNTLSNIDDRQRGMTLIELMAAILIAAMLTGWGVGQWRYHQQALRLEHTAQQLLADYRRTPTGVTARRCCGSRMARPGAWAAVCHRRIAFPPKAPFSCRLIATLC
ncbi:prepilin-type N-terminal cleavage/methylation domain-containing protein [Serratia marcescens]